MSISGPATIRPAQLEDYEETSGLMDSLDEFHRARLPWMFKQASGPARSRTSFAELLNRKDSAVFVAEAGCLVGVALGQMGPAPELPIFIQQRWGVLDALVVDPAWRRRGIGKQLTHAVEAWAIGLGAPWIELNVYEANPEARRFYEALGYLPLSTKLRKNAGAA